MLATGIAILTSVFPFHECGRASGINVAGVYLGLSLRPFLSGALTQQIGWRSIFLANVPLGLKVVGLLWRKIKGE